jgi:hypothetical protein
LRRAASRGRIGAYQRIIGKVCAGEANGDRVVRTFHARSSEAAPPPGGDGEVAARFRVAKRRLCNRAKSV